MIRSSVSTAIGDPPIGAEGTLIIDWHVGLELRNRMELKAIDKVVLCFAHCMPHFKIVRGKHGLKK